MLFLTLLSYKDCDIAYYPYCIKKIEDGKYAIIIYCLPYKAYFPHVTKWQTPYECERVIQIYDTHREAIEAYNGKAQLIIYHMDKFKDIKKKINAVSDIICPYGDSICTSSEGLVHA